MISINVVIVIYFNIITPHTHTDEGRGVRVMSLELVCVQMHVVAYNTDLYDDFSSAVKGVKGIAVIAVFMQVLVVSLSLLPIVIVCFLLSRSLSLFFR